MSAIENNTPFAARVIPFLDSHAREYAVLIVGATFVAPPGSKPALADEQLAIEPIDRHRGDPLLTSVHYPGQAASYKPMIDVIVTGHAYAPKGRRVETMVVGIRVADLKKTVMVSGDRFWRLGPMGHVPSAPQPFERLPVVYERAFGGGSPSAEAERAVAAYEPRNPVGIGLPGTATGDPLVTSEVPNIEYASQRMESVKQRPTPAGFGPISPSWQPRVGFAGTYDDHWLKAQAPLLPHDFDPRFFQAVPADQQSSAIRPGDVVDVAGMTPDGRWTFQLPPLDVPLALVHADRIEHTKAVLDTIHLEPDEYRFHLTARLSIPLIRNRAPLAQVIIGTVRPGWLRARYSGKIYQDRKAAE
jgi:hypothetical protein